MLLKKFAIVYSHNESFGFNIDYITATEGVRKEIAKIINGINNLSIDAENKYGIDNIQGPLDLESFPPDTHVISARNLNDILLNISDYWHKDLYKKPNQRL